jgi:hypothetical protein
VKTLVTKQMMFMAALLFLMIACAYAYNVSSEVKVAGCNSCPANQSSALS